MDLGVLPLVMELPAAHGADDVDGSRDVSGPHTTALELIDILRL
jgi:hypothetical protein